MRYVVSTVLAIVAFLSGAWLTNRIGDAIVRRRDG